MVEATRSPRPGDVYEIADPPNGYYYAAIGIGGDTLFFDKVAPAPSKIEYLKEVPFFLRLSVSDASIRTAWKKIGTLPVCGELNTYGKYRNQPVGSDQVYIYDNSDGSFSAASDDETENLETLATWDGTHHILPILRYHFFRTETRFRHEIRGKL
jgi:hypothetical protein